MGKTRQAVVLGAGIAGLTAARALSDTFESVVIIERDQLPAGPEDRRGIPQGRHVHGLLARGLRALEDLFPGFEDDLVAAGGIRGDIQSGIHWHIDGHLLRPDPSGLIGVAASRPLVEFGVRQRVSKLPGVTFIDNCDIMNLVTTPDNSRVTGVGVISRVDGSSASVIEADLVVDATGRGSRAPVWLKELGYPEPPEHRLNVDISYVTWHFKREPHHESLPVGTSISAYPGSRRSGFLMAVEGDRFVLSTGGIFGERPPDDASGLAAFAASLPNSAFADFLPTATLIDGPIKNRYPSTVRKHYEKLGSFPQGFLVIGDALCSFNPVYGQGMSVAAMEALLLRDVVSAESGDTAKEFFRKAARIIEIPWTIAAGSDMRHPESGVEAPLQNRIINRYLGRLYRVAADDADVARAFLRVLNLLDSPDKLLAPGTAWRVARGPNR
ncbi:FAD-binding monooxygenase [Catenulispora sp. NF23]|uniref:NAD(P)/FAD-dependent oxidoreductase n=1 Tax=Catenulispora pinistramenti TaxID=2705254 RepID=UPI001BAA2F40|nr:NAD(P)-binding protein [Catenulispora pinistramenti]MBS2538414.1 FAD-binding monooxygenase [Catenulispora pinistramenti]